MPYKSDAQRRFFHTAEARKKGITLRDVEHFDRETAKKGIRLSSPKRHDPRREK